MCAGRADTCSGHVQQLRQHTWQHRPRCGRRQPLVHQLAVDVPSLLRAWEDQSLNSAWYNSLLTPYPNAPTPRPKADRGSLARRVQQASTPAKRAPVHARACQVIAGQHTHGLSGPHHRQPAYLRPRLRCVSRQLPHRQQLALGQIEAHPPQLPRTRSC